MGTGQFALRDPAIVGLKNLQSKGLRCPKARFDTGEAMTEVSAASRAMVLGHLQVQGHDLITLARMLQGALMGRFDLQRPVLAMNTARPLGGLGIDLDTAISMHLFDLKVR